MADNEQQSYLRRLTTESTREDFERYLLLCTGLDDIWAPTLRYTNLLTRAERATTTFGARIRNTGGDGLLDSVFEAAGRLPYPAFRFRGRLGNRRIDGEFEYAYDGDIRRGHVYTSATLSRIEEITGAPFARAGGKRLPALPSVSGDRLILTLYLEY